MSTSKKVTQKQDEGEQLQEASPETIEKAEAGEPVSSEVEALKEQLVESQSQAAIYLDNLQRLQAEFINYKNRQQRDYDLSRQTMKGEIVKQVLPVIDDLELALKNRPDGEAVQGWVNGIELIYRKLESVLESEGVTRIEADGQEFDPNFHEAIAMEPSDEVKSGYIIAVLQQGYMIGERVIRPALVRVAA
ncbi:MAG: nucleotide exchange factor GrpE [Anaerolineales bacterium]|nr:nucleotide exchange factor GrpE [Anaerolineales bacterium]